MTSRLRAPAGAAAWVAIAAYVASCAPPPVRPWVHPTAAEWASARAALRDLRSASPREPYVVALSTTLRDPHSGRTVDGRGAMAVAPGRAVRMILVGGAGATLLDAWVTPEQWRIAVPPIDFVRRGGASDPVDLPVGFLRWWFFAPFDGTLFAASFAPRTALWLLRRGDAVVEARVGPCGPEVSGPPGGRGLRATRRRGDHAERVEACSASGGAAPSAGDSVRYVDETSGLRVDIAVESVGPAPADGEAFRDPDVPAPGGAADGGL